MLITYGRISSEALKAVNILKEKNVSVSVLILNKIKPIEAFAVKIANGYSNVLFYEEAVKSGSIGQSFADMLFDINYKGNYKHIAVNDEFVPHASVTSLIKKYHLDSESIVNQILEITNG